MVLQDWNADGMMLSRARSGKAPLGADVLWSSASLLARRASARRLGLEPGFPIRLWIDQDQPCKCAENCEGTDNKERSAEPGCGVRSHVGRHPDECRR